MPGSLFTYRALTPQQSRIRLLHFPPSSASDPGRPISCTIWHASFDPPPPYSALSYAWGDATRRRSILVNDAPCSITENLEIALRHVVPQDEAISLWVDALCINQDDEVEKTEQVEQMRHIYSQATSVIAWLGPADHSSDNAMQWMQRYGTIASELGIGSTPELRLRILLREFESHQLKNARRGMKEFIQDISSQLTRHDPGNQERIKALSDFFTRPFWSRAWVVQEMVHGRILTFVCGSTVISENVLHYASRLLRNFAQYQNVTVGDHRQDDDVGHGTKLEARGAVTILKIRRTAGPIPLIWLVRHLRSFQATDPRDRIFALLGLSADAQALNIRPDYQKTYMEVYIEATRALIQNGYLDILSLCESDSNHQGLPSWIPNLAKGNRANQFQYRVRVRDTNPITTALQPDFSAAGNRPFVPVPRDHVDGPNTSLPLSAVYLGRVEQVGTGWQRDLSKWLQDLKELSSPAYSSIESLHLSAICRTVVADHGAWQGDRKPRMSAISQQRAIDLLSGKDLSTLCTESFVSAGLGGYCYRMEDVAHGRRSFSASRGLFGIGPCEMEPQDLVYVLIGAHVPCILRRNTDNTFMFVGEAYVHGIMDGEAMRDDPHIETIVLS